jgi:hypothetical protein
MTRWVCGLVLVAGCSSDASRTIDAKKNTCKLDPSDAGIYDGVCGCAKGDPACANCNGCESCNPGNPCGEGIIQFRYCDGPEDCSPDEKCCGAVGAWEAACSTACGSGSDDAQYCHIAMDCPPTQLCCPFNGFMICKDSC